jgi:hypothetical protein
MTEDEEKRMADFMASSKLTLGENIVIYIIAVAAIAAICKFL